MATQNAHEAAEKEGNRKEWKKNRVEKNKGIWEYWPSLNGYAAAWVALRERREEGRKPMGTGVGGWNGWWVRVEWRRSNDRLTGGGRAEAVLLHTRLCRGFTCTTHARTHNNERYTHSLTHTHIHTDTHMETKRGTAGVCDVASSAAAQHEFSQLSTRAWLWIAAAGVTVFSSFIPPSSQLLLTYHTVKTADNNIATQLIRIITLRYRYVVIGTIISLDITFLVSITLTTTDGTTADNVWRPLFRLTHRTIYTWTPAARVKLHTNDTHCARFKTVRSHCRAEIETDRSYAHRNHSDRDGGDQGDTH